MTASLLFYDCKEFLNPCQRPIVQSYITEYILDRGLTNNKKVTFSCTHFFNPAWQKSDQLRMLGKFSRHQVVIQSDALNFDLIQG